MSNEFTQDRNKMSMQSAKVWLSYLHTAFTERSHVEGFLLHGNFQVATSR